MQVRRGFGASFEQVQCRSNAGLMQVWRQSGAGIAQVWKKDCRNAAGTGVQVKNLRTERSIANTMILEPEEFGRD